MNVRQIVKKAGGSMAVANALKINQSTVIQWHYRDSIPKKYWNYFIKRKLCSLESLFKLCK